MPHTRLRPTYTLDQDRIDALKAIAPEAFADGRIVWDTLRDLLGDHIEDESVEHFGLSWPGKREARRFAGVPSRATLVPVPGQGVDEDNTRNIFIEGENLEVLKLLLKSYAGKVKMIYIDPPYNTGNDFIYSDNFTEPLEAYLRRTGQADDEGLLTSNPKSSGRYHSNWLSMIYPRLMLARNFLSEDGIMMVSIDDNEVQNLRMLMDEIFGEDNFLAQVIVESNKRGQTYKQISKTHEYLLIYTQNDAEVNELEKIGDKDDLNFEDEVSRFNIRELRNRNPKFGRFNRPNLFYPIYVNPSIVDKDGFSPVSVEATPDSHIAVLPLNSQGGESCWRWGKQLLSRNILGSTMKSNVVARRKSDGGYNIYEKYRKTTYKAKSIWNETEVITEKGTVELGELGLSRYFDFPKPVFLVKKALMLGTDENSIVMDFFAGSATTAHSLFELNRETAGNRQFLLVQLPEATNHTEYPTIADVSKERIRRVLQRLRSENHGNDSSESFSGQDLGFRVYRLDRSHYKQWADYQGDNIQQLQAQFDTFETPLVDGWQPQDLLVEVMLIEGFPLDSTVTRQHAVTANDVRCIQSDFYEHKLWVCLDANIQDATIAALNIGPNDVFVCLDSALSDQTKVRLSDTVNLKTI